VIKLNKKENYKPDENKSSQGNTPVGTDIPQVVEQMIAHLKHDDFTEAAKLFMLGQKRGIFSGDHTLTKRLVKVIGKKTTKKLITAFAHYPCGFCKKGRSKCQNCEGHGHINHEMVCEECLGLGVIRCDFCDGSGWMAIEDIPIGLRVTVVVTRARTALSRLKRILIRPLPQPSENKPSRALKECARLLINLDRYMGVLENTVIASKTLNISETSFKNKIEKITQSCVETAIKGKEHMREIIRCMQKSSQLESEIADEDSTIRELAEKRAEFYKNLLDQSDTFTSLSEEHPFLEKVINKRVSKKFDKKH